MAAPPSSLVQLWPEEPERADMNHDGLLDLRYPQHLCQLNREGCGLGPALVIGPLVGGVGETMEIPVEVMGFPPPGVAGLAVLSSVTIMPFLN